MKRSTAYLDTMNFRGCNSGASARPRRMLKEKESVCSIMLYPLIFSELGERKRKWHVIKTIQCACAIAQRTNI
jgi:hypothetical protein